MDSEKNILNLNAGVISSITSSSNTSSGMSMTTTTNSATAYANSIPGLFNQTINGSFLRIGDFVFAEFDSVSFTAPVGITLFQVNSIIPAGYRPSVEFFAHALTLSLGAYDTSGYIRVFTNGSITIRKSDDNTSPWVGGSSGWSRISFFYKI